MEIKTYPCCKCLERKAYSEFYKDASRKTGLQSRCKICSNKESLRPDRRIRCFKNNIRKRITNTLKGKRASNRDIGCSTTELKAHIEVQFKPGMTWDNYGYGPGKWVIDHIRPISNFLKTGDDPKKANHYTNLAPLWFEENATKGAKF